MNYDYRVNPTNGALELPIDSTDDAGSFEARMAVIDPAAAEVILKMAGVTAQDAEPSQTEE